MQPYHYKSTHVPNPEMPTAQASRADNSCCQSTRLTSNLHYAVGNLQIHDRPAACLNDHVAVDKLLKLERDAAVAPYYGLADSEESPRTTPQNTSQRLEISRRLQLLNKECLALKLRIKEADAASREILVRVANRDRLAGKLNALLRDMDIARRETRIARRRLREMQVGCRDGVVETRSVL